MTRSWCHRRFSRYSPKTSGWKLSSKISLFRVSQTVFRVTPLISAQVRVAYFKMVSSDGGSSVK